MTTHLLPPHTDSHDLRKVIERDRKAIELITVVQEAERLRIITHGLAVRIVEEILTTCR